MVSSSHLLTHYLQQFYTEKQKIEQWFAQQWKMYTPPFYASVDLRHSGFKLAPVDTNLFPGGFNNLQDTALNNASAAAHILLKTLFIQSAQAQKKKILLIPENHTRNRFYAQNIMSLCKILQGAGADIRLAYIPLAHQPAEKKCFSEEFDLWLAPVDFNYLQNRLCLKDFDPHLILLNNDLSGGCPEILKNVEQAAQQILLPPTQAGWTVRRKSHHFQCYQKITQQFAQFLGIDPWILTPGFAVCEVDFSIKQKEQALIAKVQQLLEKITAKYQHYQIDAKPFVVIKADTGTYGMAVTTIETIDQIIGLNRKQRNKMAVVKEGLKVDQVLIQEGIPTIDQFDHAQAEPVIYMMGSEVIGHFYRIHAEKTHNQNLNAPGMTFVSELTSSSPELAYAHSVVARLALLAAALELEELTKDVV